MFDVGGILKSSNRTWKLVKSRSNIQVIQGFVKKKG